MRRSRFLIWSVLFFMGILLLNTNALAAKYPRTNIRFNVGVWDVPDIDTGITVHHTDLNGDERLTDVIVSGPSGSFSFSQMLGQRFSWEISLGAFSDTESQTLSRKIGSRYRSDHYETISSYSHSVSVSYITVGLIYYPLQELGNVLGGLSSFVRPYLTAGIGPYFGWDARWDEDNLTDANFTTVMGAYPGVGLDLLVSRHFILNFDLRYHIVEFSEPLKDIEDYSGVNAVAGFKIAF